MPSVLQPWVTELPMMQQSVLLSSIRGPDGLRKDHPAKYLIRWLRRCVLFCSMEQKIHTSPTEPCVGNFTGPVPVIGDAASAVVRHSRYGVLDLETALKQVPDDVVLDSALKAYLKDVDSVPHHFHMHLMHSAEILGYKHPDSATSAWWCAAYFKLVKDLHLHAETREELDKRLGDNVEGWKARDVHDGKDALNPYEVGGRD